MRRANRSHDVSSGISIRMAGVCLLLFSLSSCMVGPNYSTPDSAMESQWINLSGVSGKSSEVNVLWWKQFHDPVLNRLVETAYKNNPSLQLAGVRVLQARAQLNESIGNLFPQQQGVSLGGNYFYLPPNNSGASVPLPALGQLLNQPSSIGPNIWTGQALFSSSWEIDFWGKYRRQIQSDKASFLSDVAFYDNALVTLIADVAGSYVNLRTTEDQIFILRQNIEAQKDILRIATERFQAGQTSQLDPQQAQTELSETEAKLPSLENTLRVAKNGLAVQLGIPPARVDGLLGPGSLPKAPDTVAAGIPRDLLRRRPDVRQAGLDAASQSARIGVQYANMLPAFSLSGSFGYTDSTQSGSQQLVSNIFNWQNTLSSGGASLVMPVFNYGRLINKVRVQDALFQESVLRYQNTVLVAQKEVEDGLSGFRHARQSVLFLEKAVSSAKSSTQLSLDRYKDGQTDFTTVLTSMQQQLAVENSLAETQGEVMLSVVSVYRAVGGGWELRSGHDLISPKVKLDMNRAVPWGRIMNPPDHIPSPAPEQRPVQTPKGHPWLWNLLNINQ